MTTYVWSGALRKFVDKKTGELMPIKNDNAICRPMIVSDIEPYQSPINGAYVGGRATRREDLKKNDCVPFEPMTNRPRGISNPKIAKKYGLKLDEAAFHRERTKRIDPLAEIKKGSA